MLLVSFVSSSMPCGEKPRFVLLYGSQKGQAQSIAEGVAEVAEEHGLAAELSCLDTNAKVAAARGRKQTKTLLQHY